MKRLVNKCKIKLKVKLMKYIAVEDARKRLGRLLQEVREDGPVTIGRRGKEQAVLVSDAEYARLRRAEDAAAQSRFEAALAAIAGDVRRARLPRRLVGEAIRAARR
jgi:prevent-host-death family protein